MSRFKACGYHFAISLVICVCVMSLMFFVWYPGGYFELMGGDLLLLLIFGVDVCLGPLITLVIFKPGKKWLAFDLAVVAALQISALAYGTHIMVVARPIFTVFIENHFRVAPANEVRDIDFAKAAKPEWSSAGWNGPLVLGSEEPTDPQERSDLVFASAFGFDLHQMPKYFRDYDSQRSQVLKVASPLRALIDYRPENRAAVERFLERKGRKMNEIVYLPIRANKEFQAAMLDARTADLIDIVDAVPPPS